MNARETFAYHMTKALGALGKCDIGFVCQETERARHLLIRARAERVAALTAEGMREVDMIHEGAPQTIMQTARKVLGSSVIPFKKDCTGSSAGGDHYANILDEMTEPGKCIRSPLPNGLTKTQFTHKLYHRASLKGIRVSIVSRRMPKGIVSITCMDHAGHREQQRRLAAQAS